MKRTHRSRSLANLLFSFVVVARYTSEPQGPPRRAEQSRRRGRFAAAGQGDAAQIKVLTAKGETPDIRDAYGPTPLHLATYDKNHEAMRARVAAGAKPNAL